MVTPNSHLAYLVFFLTLALTFALAWLGRRHGGGSDHDGLAQEKLNRWLIGLSAGAAANSGFIVTGAVGLGYTYGLTWVLLPLAWLLGDIVFWSVFPARLNDYGRRSRATTLSELLTHGAQGPQAAVLGKLCALVVLLCLAGYVSAQWLAGQKFIAGAFPVGDVGALGLFAVMIIAYTAIGGFRGSVYVDSLQAVIRIVGTALALGAVCWVASKDAEGFHHNIDAAGSSFLSFLPAGGIPAALAFVLGFAAAALGFGLGQPHIVSRYLAGADPAETRAAWWIYIAFVQFTWIAMTVFGVVLRGVMPGIEDPEAGLSLFFNSRMGAIATGVIVADVFATIAATSNGLLVAMSQALTHDLLPRMRNGARYPIALGCVILGALTMGASLTLSGSIVTISIASVSMMAAGIAPAVMVRISGWRSTPASLLATIVFGLVVAGAWRWAGYHDTLNEAAPGILAGLIGNFITARRTSSSSS